MAKRLKIVNNKSTNCWLVCSRRNVVYSSGAKDCGMLVNQKRLNSFGLSGTMLNCGWVQRFFIEKVTKISAPAYQLKHYFCIRKKKSN